MNCKVEADDSVEKNDEIAAQVERLVMPKMLRFKLEDTIFSGSCGDDPLMKRNIFQRWLARRVACAILNDKTDTYQFGGYTGSLKLSYEMVDAPKEQMAHWILRRVGYVCCTADLMKLTGRPEA